MDNLVESTHQIKNTTIEVPLPASHQIEQSVLGAEKVNEELMKAFNVSDLAATPIQEMEHVPVPRRTPVLEGVQVSELTK